MRIKSALLWPVVCLSLLGIGGGVRQDIVRVRAEVPKPDFMDLAGYQRALEASTNPQAQAILQQIKNGPADLAHERAAAQKEGILLDVSQLQRPPLPATENAALLYAAWDAQRKKEAFVLPPYADTLSARVAYTPEQLARVQTLLDQHRDLMKLLHLAADTPQCDFAEARESKLFPNQFTQDIILRAAARELNTESYLLAKQGRYSEAIVDQSRGFRLAEHAVSDPSLINYLVGVAIEQITLRGMEGILDIAGSNEANVAQQVQQAVSAHKSFFSFKDDLSGDVTVTLFDYIDMFRTRTPADLASITGADYSRMSARDKVKRFSPDEQKFLQKLIDAVEAEYLHQMRSLIAVADAPPAVRQPVFAAIAAQPVSPLNPVDLFANKYLSVYPKVNEKANHQQAHEQAVLAGAAALAVRDRTGAFPEQLPGSFTDPFNNNQPLKYRREGTDGFVVYSIGPTGKFDGGPPGQSDWKPETEIAFRYPGPPPQPVPPDMLK